MYQSRTIKGATSRTISVKVLFLHQSYLGAIRAWIQPVTVRERAFDWTRELALDRIDIIRALAWSEAKLTILGRKSVNPASIALRFAFPKRISH
jgi:hypothetical protein